MAMKRFGPAILGVILPLLVHVAGSKLTAQQPAWEVHAVRYGTLANFPTRYLIAGADSTRTSEVALTVWLLKGPDRTVLVDAGFYRDQFLRSWRPAEFRRPSEVLDSLGVRAASVTDIVITHVHWDHLDGADLFPNARIWIQRAEYEHHVGAKGEVLDRAISAVDATMLHDLHADGRVRLVEGDAQEIIPGIRVYTGGRHTYASQYVGVNTRSGTVIIASDDMYLYENLERRVPIAATLDSASNLAAQDRMKTLAARPELVIPGHDPAVFTRFPVLRPGFVRID